MNSLAKAFLIFLLFVIVVNLGLVAPFFLTLFLGWMLCEILRKLNNFLLAKRMKPSIASLLSTIAAAIVIVAPIALFAVATLRKGGKWIVGIIQDPEVVRTWSAKAFDIPLVARFFDSAEDFNEWAMIHAQEAGKFVPGILSKVLGSVPDLIAQLALALIACYFFLCDGNRFSNWIAPRIPLEQMVRARLAKSSKEMVVQSALATMAAALVQAVIILVGFLILKLPIALIAFGMAFIFAWLPIVGVTPVWGLAMIVLFAQGDTGKAFVMFGFGMVAGIADNVVRPWVLKGSSDLHPLVSLIVIFGHIHFFGILGVFTGPVFAAVMIEALELWPDVAKSLGLYAGRSITEKPTTGPSEAKR